MAVTREPDKKLHASVGYVESIADEKVAKAALAELNGMVLSDTATQKEVRLMLKNLLRVLKGALACLALSFAATAAASLGDDTAWEDVDPTNKVKDVVGRFAASASITPVVEVPAGAAARGVTFVAADGIDQNVAVEIGKGAKAAVKPAALDAAPNGTQARSVSVAIGAEADATVGDGSTKNQGIAIGWFAQAKASNAIAIGSGAQHTNETAESGNATVASGATAIAAGYDAKASAESAIALGRSAKARARNAVQLGQGENSEANTLRFMDYKLLDAQGRVPMERLADVVPHALDAITNEMARLIRPGNMTCVGGRDDVVLEPMLNGVSELTQVKRDGDEHYMAGGEAAALPALGTRNYTVLVREIQQAYRATNTVDGVDYVPVEPESNFVVDFSELPLRGITPTIAVAPSIGYASGLAMVVTNAPLQIKVRQVSDSAVLAVAKPWDILEM